MSERLLGLLGELAMLSSSHVMGGEHRSRSHCFFVSRQQTRCARVYKTINNNNNTCYHKDKGLLSLLL